MRKKYASIQISVTVSFPRGCTTKRCSKKSSFANWSLKTKGRGEIPGELARRSSSRGISRKFYGSEAFQIFSSNIQFRLLYPHNSSQLICRGRRSTKSHFRSIARYIFNQKATKVSRIIKHCAMIIKLIALRPRSSEFTPQLYNIFY